MWIIILITDLCTCILVLMTSSGVFPNTLAAPAIAPNAPVMTGLMDLLGLSPKTHPENTQCDQMRLFLSVLYSVWCCRLSPLYQFLREVMTKNRIAWLDPCLRTVAVRPWYVPLIPERHIQSITYYKHTLYTSHHMHFKLFTVNCNLHQEWRIWDEQTFYIVSNTYNYSHTTTKNVCFLFVFLRKVYWNDRLCQNNPKLKYNILSFLKQLLARRLFFSFDLFVAPNIKLKPEMVLAKYK